MLALTMTSTKPFFKSFLSLKRLPWLVGIFANMCFGCWVECYSPGRHIPTSIVIVIYSSILLLIITIVRGGEGRGGEVFCISAFFCFLFFISWKSIGIEMGTEFLDLRTKYYLTWCFSTIECNLPTICVNTNNYLR